MASRSAGFLDQRKLHSPIKRDGRRKREKRTGSRAEREREKERFRFHDRIWQRLIISNDADDKLWNKLWTFPRARFVSFLGSISEQMEGNGEAGERRGDDKPFPRFAPRHTLKEFLNGQITVERISNDTFERARSN